MFTLFWKKPHVQMHYVIDEWTNDVSLATHAYARCESMKDMCITRTVDDIKPMSREPHNNINV